MDKYLLADNLIKEIDKQPSFEKIEITFVRNGDSTIIFLDEKGERIKNGGRKK